MVKYILYLTDTDVSPYKSSMVMFVVQSFGGTERPTILPRPSSDLLEPGLRTLRVRMLWS